MCNMFIALFYVIMWQKLLEIPFKMTLIDAFLFCQLFAFFLIKQSAKSINFLGQKVMTIFVLMT